MLVRRGESHDRSTGLNVVLGHESYQTVGAYVGVAVVVILLMP